MSELKPCPFCGGEATVKWNGFTVYSVGCFMCGADVQSINCREDAIVAWNTRTDTRRETIEECITIISQNTPMEGCYGCETNLYEKLRALIPDSGKVIDATVYSSGKYGAHKPVEAAEENAEFLAHFNAASPHLVNELREALGLIKLPE